MMDVELVGPTGTPRSLWLHALCTRHGLLLTYVDGDIPASYWGPPEAGLYGTTLYVRADTPIHSLLHEMCHFICMDAGRRAALNTDAGGDDLEECAVCYLSILVAGTVPGYSQMAMCRDMDRWGYSFRLGSAWAWFERDATDAAEWLQHREIINRHGQLLPSN
jgi:hypothetical protein